MSVVLFGLFHGLVYLPVILSWVGPSPYPCSLPSNGVEETDSTRLQKSEARKNQSKNSSKENGFLKVRVTCSWKWRVIICDTVD